MISPPRNEIAAYGLGRALAKEARHELESPVGTIQDSGMRPLKAGLIYFLLIFALGGS